jgi:hypothetical protein
MIKKYRLYFTFTYIIKSKILIKYIILNILKNYLFIKNAKYIYYFLFKSFN